MSGDFDPMDFQPNSLGVLVVRVIRIKDIVRTLSCTEDVAQQVVCEIRGETSADGTLAFVLPSQLARWAYKRAGERIGPPPFRTVLVNEAGRGDPLKRAARQAGSRSADVPDLNAVPELLEEVRSELSALKNRPSSSDSAVTVEETRRRLGCGRTRVFALLGEGKLRAVKKAGRKTMVSVASIELFLDGGATAGPSAAVKRESRKRRRSGRISEAILDLPV